MTSFEDLCALLRKLPGLGARSAERIALHLLLEAPETLPPLLTALATAGTTISRCPRCGNMSEKGELCKVCANDARNHSVVCVVETVPDLLAFERGGDFRGVYHVLHGRLSPIRGITPEKLNLDTLRERLAGGEVREVILALSNEIEAEATCHYIRSTLAAPFPQVKVSRIGFGLPAGGTLGFSDPATLKSALEARKNF
ncbi:MAG: recombination mediator RecR [Opitutales bacterium]|nr:recombination mediator RecR [Opitutales bacterium]